MGEGGRGCPGRAQAGGEGREPRMGSCHHRGYFFSFRSLDGDQTRIKDRFACWLLTACLLLAKGSKLD